MIPFWFKRRRECDMNIDLSLHARFQRSRMELDRSQHDISCPNSPTANKSSFSFTNTATSILHNLLNSPTTIPLHQLVNASRFKDRPAIGRDDSHSCSYKLRILAIGAYSQLTNLR